MLEELSRLECSISGMALSGHPNMRNLRKATKSMSRINASFEGYQRLFFGHYKRRKAGAGGIRMQAVMISLL
jgi:hypothetical protein